MNTTATQTRFSRIMSEHAARRVSEAMADTTPEAFGLWLKGLEGEEAERFTAWMSRALEVAG